MRQEVVIKGKGLAGSSDLTLLAKIKPGFVPALDSVTYKSRAKRLLKTLHLGRTSAHEYALVRPISDAVERVGRIHSVRVMVIEEDDRILLSATFDGSWEAYFRVLWQKTGRLLDAIYCNTVDYVSAWDHSYEEWRAWARSVQQETDFFYGQPSMTVDDGRYLRDAEQHALCAVNPAQGELENMRMTVSSVEDVAQSIIAQGLEDTMDGQAVPTGVTERELIRQGLQSLAGLYSLTDLYVPGTPDGPYLERAAVEFLSELVPTFRKDLDADAIARRFDRQIAWLDAATDEPKPAVRESPTLPQPGDSPTPFTREDVQGGIVEPYLGASHGCLLLLAFDSTAAVALLLTRLLDPNAPMITTANDAQDPLAPGLIVRNIAFTFDGLRVCGLSQAELAALPDEFRQGMAARAGQIGDLRTNHPRRWKRPRRYGSSAHDDDDRIDLAAVHAVLQLRVVANRTDNDYDYDATLPGNPLYDDILSLVPANSGTQILAVETMRRQFAADNKTAKEHFGFVDETSEPTINPEADDARVNLVPLGDILVGFDNESDHAPEPGNDPEGLGWLKGSSFLAVRKLRQFVDQLESAVQDVVNRDIPGLDAETVYGKLVGRRRNGDPMVKNYQGNNFTYAGDATGAECPLHAHIRRANPRVKRDPAAPPGGRIPHIARRGMSYGRPFNSNNSSDERGLMFMAYNASIGEQFEVIQRWLAGGNSTGSTSNLSDPLIGVPENGHKRWFRFEHDQKTVTVELDGSNQLLSDPKPIVQLEWGAYFLAPSMSALDRLRDIADAAGEPSPVWDAAAGELTIQSLLELGSAYPSAAIDEWKRVLEDVESVRTFEAASVWAAIRTHHGGVLRTPYGVLVAEAQAIRQVLHDAQGRFSACGYLARMEESIGADHLGLDDTGPGCPYRKESAAVNSAIQALGTSDTFEIARKAVHKKLGQVIEDAKTNSKDFADPRFEVTLDPREVIDEMLADLCEAWIGIREVDKFFKRGGMRWDWKSGTAPLYPGHFSASSRYIFQPRPGDEVKQYGVNHGKAVRSAMLGFVQAYRQSPTNVSEPGPISLAVLGSPETAGNDDLAARTLVGAIMGFVPTIDGALRRVLSEWTSDGTFWAFRAARGGVPFADLGAANAALLPAMRSALQLRPMPELIWRTAQVDHVLTATDGSLFKLRAGDTVVLAQVSALHQDLLEQGTDFHTMFGGKKGPDLLPTHACPGYDAGTAAMLGLLAALVEQKDSMRPGLAPSTLMIEGDTS